MTQFVVVVPQFVQMEACLARVPGLFLRIHHSYIQKSPKWQASIRIECYRCSKWLLIILQGQRIRQLEDALAIFQSGISTEPHPLLRDELLAIKYGPEKGPSRAHDQRTKPQEPLVDSIDALGTLTIGNNGEARYFGRSAGSEVSAKLMSFSLNTSIHELPDTVLGQFNLPFRIFNLSCVQRLVPT